MIEKELTEQQLEAIRLIRRNPLSLAHYDEKIERIRKNPLLLKEYKAEEQFPELCLEAVEDSGSALGYVKEQMTKICLKAVRKSPWALPHGRNQFVLRR